MISPEGSQSSLFIEGKLASIRRTALGVFIREEYLCKNMEDSSGESPNLVNFIGYLVCLALSYEVIRVIVRSFELIYAARMSAAAGALHDMDR